MYYICLAVLLVCICMDASASLPATTIAPDVTSNNTNSLKDSFNCSLYPVYDVQDQMKQFLTSNAKLIEIDITFLNMKPTYLTEQLPDYYNPYLWVRSTGRQGRTLLMLDDNYQFMSLSFLSLGVERLNVTLADSPAHCLMSLTPEELLESVRRLLLNDFEQEDDRSFSVDDHICNVRVKDNDGLADFVYVCCNKSSDDVIICKDLENDEWMTTLKIFINIINFVIICFGPSFIQRFLYRLYFVDSEYIYRLVGERRIRFVVTKNPSNYGRENKVVRLSTVPDMKNFKNLVYNSNTKRDCVYQLTVDRARLKIKDSRMLPENDVPVGLVRMMYSNLLRCQIRHLWPLRDCCNTSIFLSLKPVSWYKCGLFVSKIVQIFVVLSPWFICLWVFYRYEAAKIEIAKRLGLRYTDDMTSFLVIIMCVILVVDAVLYTVMAQATKRKLKDLLRKCLYSAPVQVVMLNLIVIDLTLHRFTSNDTRKQLKNLLRKCLRDRNELSASEVCAWSISLMVLPFRKCGVLGLLVFPLYFVILLIVIWPVFFSLIPAVNISLRLFDHIFLLHLSRLTEQRFMKLLATEEERLEVGRSTDNSSELGHQLTTKEKFIHSFVFAMFIASFWFFLLIPLIQGISFFVMMAIYTLMGIIVNAKNVTELVTVIFMVVMYGRSTFNSVQDKYLAYHQQIHKQLLALKKEEIHAMAETLKEEKFALRVEGELTTSPEPDIRVIVKSGIPHWQTSRLLLFLDKYNTFTPKKFFYDTICLDYYGAPGPLYVAFTAAAWSFGYILLFLFFVFVVVTALGNSYISPTNQLLATVAGGFLLFLFRNVFMPSKPPSLQTDSIQFRSQFHQVINCYKQKWPVYDFTFTQVSPVDRPLGPAFHQGSESSEGEDDLDMIIDVSTEDSRNTGSLEMQLNTDDVHICQHDRSPVVSRV